jgi:hypothetical protein
MSVWQKFAASTIFLFLHLDIGAKKRQVTKLFHLHCPLPRTALKLWTFMCEIVSRARRLFRRQSLRIEPPKGTGGLFAMLTLNLR